MAAVKMRVCVCVRLVCLGGEEPASTAERGSCVSAAARALDGTHRSLDLCWQAERAARAAAAAAAAAARALQRGRSCGGGRARASQRGGGSAPLAAARKQGARGTGRSGGSRSVCGCVWRDPKVVCAHALQHAAVCVCACARVAVCVWVCAAECGVQLAQRTGVVLRLAVKQRRCVIVCLRARMRVCVGVCVCGRVRAACARLMRVASGSNAGKGC